MIVIANVFAKLETLKILFRPLSEKRRLRTRFDSQHVKAFQTLPKSPCFSHVFSSFSRKLISKISPLVLGDIIGVSIHTFTDDGKYFVKDCENLQLPIEMQLSEK